MQGIGSSSETFAGGKAQFRDLSPSEELLFECVKTGKVAHCGLSPSDEDPGNQPATASAWGPERSVRGAVIEWLCRFHATDMHPAGIQVHGARFVGDLNLEFIDSPLHLAFLKCSFPSAVMMRAGRLREVSFTGSHLRSLGMRRAILSGSLFLNGGCFIKQKVDLEDAQIGQDLDCSGSTFAGHSEDGQGFDGDGLYAASVVVGSDLILSDGFTSLSGVNLSNGRIGGDLTIQGGTFWSLRAQTGKGDSAGLNADSLQVRRDVVGGSGLKVHGVIFFENLVCGGDFDLTGGTTLHALMAPESDDRQALNIQGARIGGDIMMDSQFRATGTLAMTGAHIEGSIAGTKVTLLSLAQDDDTIEAENVVVGGDINLVKADISGLVTLDGCSVGGDINCTGAELLNASLNSERWKGDALRLQRANIKGSVYLSDGFHSRGPVMLSSTNIGAMLQLSGALLDAGQPPAGKDATALSAENVTLGASLSARAGFTAYGLFSILHLSATSLEATGATFINPYQPNVSTTGLAIKAGNSTFKQDVRLNGCLMRGQTSFNGALIGGDFDGSSTAYCQSRADLNPADLNALMLQRSQVTGKIFLGKPTGLAAMRAFGGINLDYLQCSGDVFFDGAVCSNPLQREHPTSGIAINVFNARLARSLCLRNGFSADGEVYIANTTIGDVLACRGGSFSSPHGRRGENELKALAFVTSKASSIEVDEGCRIQGLFDLSGTSVETYADDKDHWPPKGQLLLDGFSYKKFVNSITKIAETRIDWLRLQPTEPLSTSSYLNLAKMLTDNGDDSGAQLVRIALEDDRTRQKSYGAAKGLSKLFYWVELLATGRRR